MNVSVDGFVERHAREHSDLAGPDWIRIDEQLHREFNARGRALSMMVEGRVVHDMMDPFWPDARSDESLPDYLREWAEIWTAMPKVLVSRTRTSAGHNTRVFGGDDAIARLAELRRDADGDIAVGGTDLATQLLGAGLIDEVLLYTHPAVLGTGRPLFDRPERAGDAFPAILDLLEQRSFDNGVTLHRYEVRRPER
jgi:dihydrofolate reductase